MGSPCSRCACESITKASSPPLLAGQAAPLSDEAVRRLETIFRKMDMDGNKSITREEAVKFWGKNFAKVNAKAMFEEVDRDHNGTISEQEFMAFWQQVKDSGYSDGDIVEELEAMLTGGSWVDWLDGRSTGVT